MTRRRQWEKAFLNALAVSANVTASCKAAGIGRRTAYLYREQSPAFAQRWDEACREYIDALELKASTIALQDNSESMIRWLLPRLDPKKWGDPEHRVEISGPEGGPMQTVQTTFLPDPETWAEIIRIRESQGKEPDNDARD